MGIGVRFLVEADREAVREMLVASRAFSSEEVRVAMEILDDGLQGGPNGDYPIFAADIDGRLGGYACIGQTPLTTSTWHLYWICVHPEKQGRGLGRALQREIESFIRARSGQRIVIETSGRSGYDRTRRFYDLAGYKVAGRIPDYYRPGDDCLFYYKELGNNDEVRAENRQSFKPDE